MVSIFIKIPPKRLDSKKEPYVRIPCEEWQSQDK